MRKLLKKLFCTSETVIMLTAICTAFPFASEAKEQTLEVNGQLYEFGEKSEYDVDSSTPSENADDSMKLGSLSINGNINRTYDKDGYAAYEIADGEIFTIDFKYINSLKNAGENEWHLIEDGNDVVNGTELSDDIDYGALILQTSLDGQKWVNCKTHINVTADKCFEGDQINNIQLANGCYYRIIAAYEIEKKTKDDNFLFIDTSDYNTKKIAEVFTFYASYKDTDTTPTGEKFYFYAGGKNSGYTVGTKNNNYSGSEKIDTKDPHYGWDLGYFCLSGYTDKGDDEDVYLKKVGNKVKLTFRLDQDIKKLNGNSELVIASDKNGSDEEFKIPEHNMKHGELIIRHTDSENITEEVKYSDYLAALAYPGADTSIQLFEEGDYEVHLDYAITDKAGVDSTTYYQTSFKFKIRNANCMVYIFDSSTGAELSNGDVTENGFRIDTAKSSYPKIQVKKEIFNNTKSGLVEDTRFNGAASDGETFSDEGIYTITAYNRYDDKLEPAVKTIYVGTNNILTAFTKNIDSSTPYTIAQLVDMQEEGYEITDDGEIISPVSTTIPVTESVETTTTKLNSTTVSLTRSETSETTSTVTAFADIKEGQKKSNAPIIVGCVAGVLVIGGIVTFVLINKKKQQGGSL